MTGWSWRYVRDWARAHNVPILRAGAKPLIRASELIAAIERVAAREARIDEGSPAELERMRSELIAVGGAR